MSEPVLSKPSTEKQPAGRFTTGKTSDRLMPNFICTTCGTQHADSDHPPAQCAICEDDRQYVKATGQQWTTLERLRLTNWNSIRLEEPGLIGIGVEPQFAIGQRALLIKTPKGNVLWDCIPLVDPAVVEMVNAFGGITAIGISHPHYYSSMVEWSRAFGGVPVYLHAADKQWIMRPDKAVVLWDGEAKPLDDGLTLIRSGGHFGGGTVLHWRDGAAGEGALLTGDIIQVVPDRKHVSFMYSYPNYVPLAVAMVEQILAAVEPFAYDRLYGAFWDMVIPSDGKTAVKKSAERYIRAIEPSDGQRR
jgi:glyoxylase-like metal-dependent hydrolase (beta-lactamase superfamily II)